MDDRANTFMVKNLNGHTFYFQAESFDSAIAWRVTIESMIMAAQSDEHSPAVSFVFFVVGFLRKNKFSFY